MLRLFFSIVFSAGLLCQVFARTRSFCARRTIASLISGVFLTGGSSGAAHAVDVNYSPLDQVARVYYSLPYIDESIEKETPTVVVGQVRLLLSNYALKDNVLKALDFIPSSAQREEGRIHGLAAYEDLAIVGEYFEDDVDNQSGKKQPPKEVLLFAQKAASASSKEFLLFKASLPLEAKAEWDRVKEEFTTSEKP